MLKKVSVGLISLASTLALSHEVASAATPASASAQSGLAQRAAACVTSYGTQGSSRTFTEHFTHNCLGLQVRLKVVCHDKLTGVDSNDYGGTLNGVGTSTYRCNSIERIQKGTGHGQYYDLKKWVDLPH